jgi:putative ABC transport system substrate-binding protein
MIIERSRRAVLAAVIGAIAASTPGPLSAQTPAKPVRIGVLGAVRTHPLHGILLSTLREAGWIEGTNATFEFRSADGRMDRFRELAAELVALNVNVIVCTGGATATLAAKAATTTIPIVFINAADPVKFGLVASLARPEANVTGIALPAVDWGKWLQIAHEALPAATRVAVVGNSSNLTYADYAAQNQAAAQRLGLQLQMIALSRPEEFGDAFAAMKRARAEVLVFGPDALFMVNAKQIIELAGASQLPVIGPDRVVAALGAIASYGFDARHSMRRGAEYVDRILRGAKPAQLPVDQPTRFELVVNVGAAKSLGVALPQSLLLQADEVLR